METLGLYKVYFFWKGKLKATMKCIHGSRREAYYELMDKAPRHNQFDAVRIREALPTEKIGQVIEKNDKKRK